LILNRICPSGYEKTLPVVFNMPFVRTNFRANKAKS
jgi:hypothetical protein